MWALPMRMGQGIFHSVGRKSRLRGYNVTSIPQAISGLLMHTTTRRNLVWTLACILFAALALLERAAWGQPTDVPSIEDVKQLQARFQAERQKLQAAKSSSRLMDKAAEFAERAEKALTDGRLRQA